MNTLASESLEMRFKIFGQRTGLKVSEIILGTGMFGTAWGYGAEPDEVRHILRGYADAGGNFIDTADNYQFGESERQIGEFVAPCRDDFVIASKFSRGATANPALTALGNNRKAMVQAVEESLKRLRTDRIDLYFVHMEDGVTPVEEIARGLDDLVRAGKIVYTGLSNFPAWRVASAVTLADLRGWTSIAAIQVEYSLLERTTERELLPMADGLGLGVMGWSPMAGGLLTGKYRKGERGRATDLKASVLHDDPERNASVIDTLIAIAREIGSNPGRVAIAWVRAKGVLPIIGPRTRAQLDDNLAAASLSLSSDQIRRLDEVSAVRLGYPHELNTTAEQRATLTGNRWDKIDFPGRTVA
jgi:aryl-alcohol dehydrogenase-like predicted oxidoreductase